MNYELLVRIIQRFGGQVRVKVKWDAEVSWSTWIIIPTSGYIELSEIGPYPVREIEWLEINPIKFEHIGRLVPPRRIDNTSQLEADLRNADIPYTILDGLVKISF